MGGGDSRTRADRRAGGVRSLLLREKEERGIDRGEEADSGHRLPRTMGRIVIATAAFEHQGAEKGNRYSERGGHETNAEKETLNVGGGRGDV